jgi:Second Messenger Oligonucleotide or Dinucleotide Synthetase domain
VNLQDAFDTFYDKIELRALSEERIGSAWRRLHDHLTQAYSLPDRDVFIQGSYANDTAIRPADADGEYDLDIVAVCVDPTTSAEDAVAGLREVLAQDADLAKRLIPDESGRPCVRLEYAKESEGFGFHVDVVPARLGQEAAPLDVPMRGYEDWHGTAPLEYTQWCLDQGEPFRRTVRELKRWCDVHDSSIKSIVLQVLIGYCMPENAETDAQRIVLTLENIMARLNAHPDTPPIIENPVLVTENLASRWENTDYQRFLRELGEAITLAKQALRSDDEEESHELWQELLGSDFPDAPDRSKDVTVPPPPPPQRKPKPERGRRYG